MATTLSLCPTSRTQSFLVSKTQYKTQHLVFPTSNSSLKVGTAFKNVVSTHIDRRVSYMSLKKAVVVVVSATGAEKEGLKKQRYPVEAKGFVDEMRLVAMKMHTKDQSKEGEKEPKGIPVAKWEPSIDGYLRFLVDSKLVYDTLEAIVEQADFPSYAEFKNTGLERSKQLAQDFEWFIQRGHSIPEPSPPGITYARYLDELSKKNDQAFLCHFYTVYFGHSAGGLIIGKKVAEKIINEKVLEFYKWDSDVSQLLQNVREKLNEVALGWTREEKDHCLEETEKAFKHSSDIIQLVLS